jgi:hypothetical protein
MKARCRCCHGPHVRVYAPGKKKEIGKDIETVGNEKEKAIRQRRNNAVMMKMMKK